MTTEGLLIAYGYTEVAKGLFLPARPSSERWEKTEGGWLCYRAGSGDGRALDGGLVQIPFTTTQSGVHPSTSPDAFEWVWPDERLQEIYEPAVANL